MKIEESQRYFDAGFRERRVMAILRGSDVATTVRHCRRAWDAGLPMVEIPLQTPESEQSLRAAVEEARRENSAIGAGTIVTIELVERAAAAGAAFTVAPGFDLAVLARSLELGMPHLPGVSTPTEVQSVMNLGARWLKAFPANALGVQWFAAMKGPFPDIDLVATGGVTGENALKFLQAGASAVSLGSSFADLSSTELAAIR